MMLKWASNDYRLLYCHLLQIGKKKEALDFAIAAKCLCPPNSELEEMIEDLKKQLATGQEQLLFIICFWVLLMVLFPDFILRFHPKYYW